MVHADDNLTQDISTSGTIASCRRCGEQTFLLPLHGARGGPLCCPLCIGKFHAEHGKRRRLGRIVIRALRAYLDAEGSKLSDIDKLKQSVICGDFFSNEFLGHEVVIDPLGYLADTASTKGDETIDLTSELLSDAIKLAHPDHHPPEREELARRTTQGLLALQPFTFPAPKPKPKPKPAAAPAPERDGSVKSQGCYHTEPSRPAYPCANCRDTIYDYYCDPCRAEWDLSQEKQREQEGAKRRRWYARRKARDRRSKACAACGASFNVSGGAGTTKRKDAKFCSAACRQRAHRKAVTDKTKSPPVTSFSRNADAEVRS